MTSQIIIENLFTNQTTNGNGTPITYNGTRERLDLHFQGTFDGANIAIQASTATGTTYTNVSGGEAITSNIVKSFEVSKGSKIRAVVTSAGGSTDLTVIASYLQEW